MRQKTLAISVFIFGIALLVYTWKPIVEWQLLIKPQLKSKSANFLSPLAILPESAFESINTPLIGNSGNQNLGEVGRGEFFLTIEKFGIVRAKVVTGDNFKTQLAHLPGSVGPGSVGNVVISGHSVLPQFFSSKNYLAIFSRLYLLETGDKVILEKDERSYTYEVSDLLVVKPRDIWVLAPPDPFSSNLTLLTCGVGGWTNERIIIRAKLQDSQDFI